MSYPVVLHPIHAVVTSIEQAETLVERCLSGEACHLPRKPFPEEWEQVARPGNVFVYEENSSGFREWQDPYVWERVEQSPHRICDICPERRLVRLSMPIVRGGVEHTVVSYQEGMDMILSEDTSVKAQL